MMLIRQPVGSSMCGQCCIAMAAGVSRERACEVIGHSHGTTTKELIAALRALDIECADKLRRLPRLYRMPARAILVVREARGSDSWHWVLWHDGRIYDPDGEVTGADHISSFLEIYE